MLRFFKEVASLLYRCRRPPTRSSVVRDSLFWGKPLSLEQLQWGDRVADKVAAALEVPS
ncbi:hypothetical protein POG22_10200 [Geitlerinema sp. CS-897]|uniref:hypothetical protein n=1 Tax=Baaleninema simplex TaxID=2862350 RepID=UPI00037C71E8|nr:hypothetical protein [Baaleninema simplex]MDC0833373.1 hypothetical protein [Geitlerinema sp. CS-897]